MKVENMDPRTVAYLASILVPATMTIGGWALSCVKAGVNRIKVNREVKKLTEHIDEYYEELCKTYNR